MKLSKKQERNAKLVIDTLLESDIAEEMHVGILCVLYKESRMNATGERGYSKASNERIRKVFGKKKLGKYFNDDLALTQLKRDDESFFNMVYRSVAGNKEPGDGWRYRGFGFVQLTGRGNYKAYSYKGADLVKNPELLHRSDVAAKVAVKFYRRQLNKIKDLACDNDEAAVAIAANVTAGLGKSVYSESVQRAINNASKYIAPMRSFYENYIAEKGDEQNE